MIDAKLARHLSYPETRISNCLKNYLIWRHNEDDPYMAEESIKGYYKWIGEAVDEAAHY